MEDIHYYYLIRYNLLTWLILGPVTFSHTRQMLKASWEGDQSLSVIIYMHTQRLDWRSGAYAFARSECLLHNHKKLKGLFIVFVAVTDQ